ncbi:diguanylate cyclase domain-containing protein [Vibrio alfacsensis]|uniref:diguanylate cyclase domain-containing protein n=1 Tax=Vibrio alfacsensis TaxID=1074311 RepID=UPI0040697981
MISDRFAHLPLRYKMMLPTWFMVMMIVILIGAPAIHFVLQSQREAQDERIYILSQGVATTLQAALMFDDPITAKEQLVNLTFDPDIIAAKVINSYGTSVAHIHQLPNDCQWINEQVSCDGVRYHTALTDIVSVGDTLGQLVLWVSQESLHKKEQQLLLALAVLTLVISLFSWFFARLLRSVIVKPLSALHASMEHMIAEGIAKSTIPIRHDDEIGKLTACFNEMIENLVEREHQLQSALLRVEQKNRYIHGALDVMKRGVVVASPDSKVNYYNPIAASEIFSDNQSHPINIRRVLESQFESKTIVETVLNAVEQHQPLASVELKTRMGGKRYSISCHPMEEQQQSLLQFHDVTAQLIAEQRRKLLELMFDQNQDGLFVLDRHLNVKTQNAAAMNWFGELQHIKDLPLRKPLFLSQKQTRDLLKNGVVFNDIEIETQTKCWLSYEMKAKALKGLDGCVEAIVISLTDLSVGMELKRLSFVANHDPLTGLANRSKALTTLQAWHDQGSSLFIFFIDLDGFKAVNDQFGHAVGDELLRVVAKRLQQCISSQDLVSRISGDEFVLGIHGADQCKTTAQRIIDTLSNPIVIDSNVCHVTASIGISYWSAESRDVLDEKIALADSHMYVAKRQGKNGYYYAA